MAKRTKKPQPPPQPRFPLVVETFRDPEWSLREMARSEPSAINWLSYRKYRVTAELIDEPKEVLVARLQDMWERCNGYNESQRIFNEALRLGHALVGEYGAKRRAASVSKVEG